MVNLNRVNGLKLLSKRSMRFVFVSMLWLINTSVLAESLPKLTIVTEQFPPYNYVNDQNQLDGVSTRIVQAALKHMKQTVNINVLPWQQALTQAKTTENTLIYSILRTPEREPYFIWLATNILIEMNFYGHCDNQLNTMSDLASIKHQRIGLLAAGSYDELIRQHMNVEQNQLIYGKNYRQLYQKLQDKQLDIMIAPHLLMLYMWHQMPSSEVIPKLYSIPKTYQNQLYMAFNRKTDARWIKLWHKTLRQMKKSGEIQAIYQEFEQQHKVLTSLSPFK